MLEVGIVGLANIGKSTLFTALTKQTAECANFPFCTIEPNQGIATVPDHRLEKLSTMSESAKTVPAVVKFVDIAGLVKGAHKGEGLGNKFLANIREMDLILHLVRGFNDDNIAHVGKGVDPADDLATIDTELLLADLEVVNKRLSKVQREAKTGDKEKTLELSALKKIQDSLNNNQFAKFADLDKKELKVSKPLNLITSKTFIKVLNTNEEVSNTPSLPEFDLRIPIKTEAEIKDLSEAEKTDYRELIKENKLNTLNELITTCYTKLDLITFLTTGKDESRAWTTPKGSTAPEAAGKIHTDFAEKFIKAEIINWEKLLTAGSWTKAKEQGQIRLEGKEYIMQDGDVADFKIG